MNFDFRAVTHVSANRRPHHKALQCLPLIFLAVTLAGCGVSPDPMSNADVASTARARLESSVTDQVPVSGTIDLAEAMARAVIYNLDDRVQKVEGLLASSQLTNANAAMLPNLTASVSRNSRDKIDASSSFSVSSGQQSLATSTSQDETITTSNAALAWNVLDLGLSYVRAKQAADQVLASQERRRKVLARLIEDVRTTYWRAVAADYLSRELPKVEERARAALDQSKTLIGTGNVSPLSALSYQKEILELQDRLQSVQMELVSSRAQLAALMNLPPGTPFNLVRPKFEDPGARIPDGKSMLISAMEQRPEIREALYQERIASRESLAAVLETLPSVNVFLNANTTSNSYSLNKEWLGWGSQASFNLMRVFTLSNRLDTADLKDQLAEERSKALVSTVAMQVAISREKYAQARRRWQTAKASHDVEGELLKQLESSLLAAKSSEQDLVREEMAALFARIRYDTAIAELQSSWASIQTTMGRDPYPAIETGDFDALKASFREKLTAGAKQAQLLSPLPSPTQTAELVIEQDAQD